MVRVALVLTAHATQKVVLAKTAASAPALDVMQIVAVTKFATKDVALRAAVPRSVVKRSAAEQNAVRMLAAKKLAVTLRNAVMVVPVAAARSRRMSQRKRTPSRLSTIQVD